MLILFRCPAGWTLLDSWLYSSDYLMNRVCKLYALFMLKLQLGMLQSHKCGTYHQQLITGTLLCDIPSTSFRLRRSIATCGMWHTCDSAAYRVVISTWIAHITYIPDSLSSLKSQLSSKVQPAGQRNRIYQHPHRSGWEEVSLPVVCGMLRNILQRTSCCREHWLTLSYSSL